MRGVENEKEKSISLSSCRGFLMSVTLNVDTIWLGIAVLNLTSCLCSDGEKKPSKRFILRAGFEPATYGYLLSGYQLQSTALPTELSKVHVSRGISKSI